MSVSGVMVVLDFIGVTVTDVLSAQMGHIVYLIRHGIDTLSWVRGWCFMSSSVTMNDASSQSHTHLDRIRLRGLSQCMLGGFFLWLDQQMGHWYLILLILYFIWFFFCVTWALMLLLSGTLMLNLVMWDITFSSCWSFRFSRVFVTVCHQMVHRCIFSLCGTWCFVLLE